MKNTVVTVGIAILLVIGFYSVKRYYLKPKIEHGVKATEINGILPDGSPFALSNLKGKYVLLDFWGSWCKPCRDSHPVLKRLYEEFRAKEFRDASGFEVVGYGVERNLESWKAAMRVDGLPWPYQLVSADLFNSPTIKAYGVKQIPTRFLINPGGIIIAVDPSLSEVREILANK